MKWYKTKNKLPTKQDEQIKVLFYSTGWALPIYGLFSKGEFLEYDQQNDRYLDNDNIIPEFWCYVDLPEGVLC